MWYAVLIDEEKTYKILEYNTTAAHIIESGYSPAVLSAFAILLLNAQAGGLANRAAYIQQLISWGFVIQGTYEAKKAEVKSKTTRLETANVAWDIKGLKAADPKVTLAGAMAITN